MIDPATGKSDMVDPMEKDPARKALDPMTHEMSSAVFASVDPEQLDWLADRYGLPKIRDFQKRYWMLLTCILHDFVPGFSAPAEKARTGPRLKWNEGRFIGLILNIAAVKRVHGITDTREALQRLTSTGGLYERETVRSLEARLSDARKSSGGFAAETLLATPMAGDALDEITAFLRSQN